MREIANPPSGMLLVLWPFKGERNYPQIVGDLNEEYRQRAAEKGSPEALRWFRREIWRTFWVLTWRPATLAAIFVPLFCIAIFNLLIWYLRPLLFKPIRLAGPPSMSWLILRNLRSTTIEGLAVGALGSLILRGHERMLRLVWGAYYLALIVMYLVTRDGFLSQPLLNVPLIVMMWTYLCIWSGSFLIERRNRRRIAS